jgi:D-sedoheptulose 7-phosphate isomerase
MSVETIRENMVRTLRECAEVRLRLLDHCGEAAMRGAQVICDSFRAGGKLLLFGNGGSAADCQHIAAEFVCRFRRQRDPLPAIALTTDASILTAVSNDYGFEQVFARQVLALGGPQDVVLAISTSGRSPNVLAGVRAARPRGLHIIALTGAGGGQLARMADTALVVPSKNTAYIQECHITLGHILCEAAETLWLSGEPEGPREARRKAAARAGAAGRKRS